MSWTLVTGGAKGLGAEICRTLASQGRPVVIHYNRSEREAENVKEECEAQGVAAEIIQGNFSTREGTLAFCNSYLARFSQTRGLVNNVGNFLVKSTLQTELEEWEALFQNNLHVPFALIKSLAPSLKKEQGSVVNIGVVGLHAPRADTYCTAYTAAKLALWLMTKSLAKELLNDRVRVNMVSPGYLENAVDLPTDPAKIPMGRPGKLSEVAELVVCLLEPTTGYITGQNIEIAGGLRL